jgi:cell division initiation protein
MIDLTPLDVRKKRGDFGKGLRGYDPQEVDTFLELVAERLEVLVKENVAFRGRVGELEEKVVAQQSREQAIQDALVTAQEFRQDVKKQARREANLLEREAQGKIDLMIGESEKLLSEHRAALQELERQRERFLKAFRSLLERELDTVEVEFGRPPLEDVTLDLELGRRSGSVWEPEGDDEDRAEGQAEYEDEHDDVGQYEGENDDQDPAPRATGSDARAVGAEDDEGDRRPPEGEGDDSLWLSSIMSDPKDEDPE